AHEKTVGPAPPLKGPRRVAAVPGQLAAPAVECLRADTTENIFINYRRDDAAAYAGRIADRFGALLGVHRVFMDVEDIGPGQNFAEAIDRTLASCSIVLVVIGPRWGDIL